MTAALLNESLQHSLQRTEARMRAMFEQSAVGMAMADRSGVLFRVNAAFARMIGYEPDEVIGKSFIELTHPDDVDRATSLLIRADAIAGPAVTYEKRYIRKDGSVSWVRATVSRLFNSDGTFDCYTAVVEDISAARAAQDELATQLRVQ